MVGHIVGSPILLTLVYVEIDVKTALLKSTVGTKNELYYIDPIETSNSAP